MKELLKIMGYLTIFCLIFILFKTCVGTFGDAANTVQKEFQASTMLKRYEWFKDASAQLDKKIADSKLYQIRLNTMREDYKGEKRSKWSRDDREQYNVWVTELDGIKASYNSLAAEYNAAMSKFNYAFTNVGSLPSGATTILPREYKPYIEQ